MLWRSNQHLRMFASVITVSHVKLASIIKNCNQRGRNYGIGNPLCNVIQSKHKTTIMKLS